MADWIPWDRVFVPAPDKTAVVNPYKSMKLPSGKRSYNLDFDEDVEDLLSDIENDPILAKAFNVSMLRLRRGARGGSEKAKNMHPAILDALGKNDPLGLRADGRKAVIPNDLDVRPDFNFDAVEGENDVDKKFSYEGLLGRYRGLYSN